MAAHPPPSRQLPAPHDGLLLARLRAGDETALVALVRRHEPAMLHVARTYVPSAAIAEEVVQDTWLRVIAGLDRFEGRSSLRTWLFSILVNCARRGADRERRTVPFSAIDGVDADARPLWANAGEREPPEALAGVAALVAPLPATQRAVLVLRDVVGWDSAEVCRALGITAANQRVLLHRARRRVRGRLGATG